MSQVAARTYEFTLTLAGDHELTSALADALWEAGCDDCTPRSTGTVVFLDFHRDADSLGKAIGSAVADVESAGFAVARVDVEQPAGNAAGQ